MGYNDDLIKAGTGYAAGNAIANSIAYNLRKQAEKIAEETNHITPLKLLQEGIAKFILSSKQDEALEWLNECIQTEMIGYARKQEDTNTPLQTSMNEVREKYLPFYDKIGKEMPAAVANLTADSLCELLGVEHAEKRRAAARALRESGQLPDTDNSDDNTDSGLSIGLGGLVFIIIMVIIIVITQYGK